MTKTQTENGHRKGSVGLVYPLVRRTLVIDDNDWRWLQSHRDEYGCASVSQMLRIMVNLERAKHMYRAAILNAAAD